jgi:hypothetical protein
VSADVRGATSLQVKKCFCAPRRALLRRSRHAQTALGITLGLAIVSGSITLTRTAKAQFFVYWRNYASGALADPLYLTNRHVIGEQLFLSKYSPIAARSEFDYLPLNGDPGRPGFTNLAAQNAPGFPPNPPLVVGVSGNHMVNGTPIIDWSPTGELNQDWWAEPVFNDANGAACYVLVNANSLPGRVCVLGVSGGRMADVAPIILWDYLADPVGHPDQFWCTYRSERDAADSLPRVPFSDPFYPAPQCGILHKGESLVAGTSRDLVLSCDGRFLLVMQTDGNLVLYQNGVGHLWATNTNGRADNPNTAMLAFGGRLLVKSGLNEVWSSGSTGGDHLLVQDDGNVVVYAGPGKFDNPLWASNTCCR